MSKAEGNWSNRLSPGAGGPVFHWVPMEKVAENPIIEMAICGQPAAFLFMRWRNEEVTCPVCLQRLAQRRSGERPS